MDTSNAFSALASFSGNNLTETLSRIEQSLVGKTAENCSSFLSEHKADHDVLSAAGLIKQLAGQINVVIHALGIMLCLPHILQPGEVVESSSLGAGNTGKSFDLETNLRVAEFKFITWQGGPESIRQNSLFKDFYGLAQYDTSKSKHMYVIGTEIPIKFLRGKRSLKSVLSKDVTLYEKFTQRYPSCRVVSDYYSLKSDAVFIEDVSVMVPELVKGWE